METSNILKEMASLPIEAQKQVIDFIAFLKTRYPTVQIVPKTKRVRLSDEPFIGMWRGDVRICGIVQHGDVACGVVNGRVICEHINHC